MPSFEIVETPPSVSNVVQKTGDGLASLIDLSFIVENRAADPLPARFRARPQDDSPAEWFSIRGEIERTLTPGERQTVTVQIVFPRDTKPGRFRFQLRVVNVLDPSNDFVESPPCVLDLLSVAPPVPPPAPLPPIETFRLARVLTRAVGIWRSRCIMALFIAACLVWFPIFALLGPIFDVSQYEMEYYDAGPSPDGRWQIFLALCAVVGSSMVHVLMGGVAAARARNEKAGRFRLIGAVLGGLPRLIVIGPIVHLSILLGIATGRNKYQLAAILMGAEGKYLTESFKRSAELMRTVPPNGVRFHLVVLAIGLLGLAWFIGHDDEGRLRIFSALLALLTTFTAAYCASLYLEARMILGETPTPNPELIPPAK